MNTNKTKTQIQTELEQAYQRIAELESAANVNGSEELFLRIFEASPTQMALTDTANGKYVDVNEAFLRSLGFERKEVVGKTAFELNLFVNPAQRAELLQRMGVQGYLRNEHVLVRAKAGEVRHGIFSAEYIHANGQKLLLTVMNDVTEKMQAEERWQFALEGAGDGVWDLNMQTNHVFYSRQWKSMLGYEEDEIGDSMDEWTTRIHPDDLPSVQEKINQYIENQIPAYSSEYRICCKDGAYKWVLARGKIIEWTEDKKPLRVIGTHKDISERKAAEERLRESEERFSRVFQSNPAAQLIVSTEDGRVLDVNEAYCRQTGFARAELVGHTTRELKLWSDPSQQMKIASQLRAGVHVSNVETEFQNKSGEMRTLLISFDPVELRGVTCIISSAVDITERKQAEESLRQSNEVAQAILNASDETVFLMETDGTVIAANEIAAARLGKQVTDLVGTNIYNLLPPEVAQTRKQRVESVIRELKPAVFEDERYGVWLENRIYPILDEDGQIRRTAIFGRDITERKHAEEALKESEAKFQSLFRNLPMQGVIYRLIYNAQGEIEDWEISDINPLGAASIGSNVDDALGKRALDLFGAEVMGPYLQTSRQITSGKPLLFETHFDKNGRDYLSSVFLVGREHYVNISVDITERKRAEQALSFNEAKWRSLFESCPVGIVLGNDQGELLDISPAYLAQLGYTHDEMAKKRYEDITPPKWYAQEAQNIAQLKATGLPVYFEKEHIRKDGTVFPVALTGWVIRDESGAPSTLGVFVQDISDRKQAEEALHETESRYRLLVETSIEGIWSMDREHRTSYVNQSMADMLGYEPAEMLGKKVEEFFFPEDMDAHQTHMEKRHSGQDEVYERRFRRRDDSQLWALVSARVQKDSQGKFNGSFAMFTDITERKQAEISLHQSELRYRSLFDDSPIAIWEEDFSQVGLEFERLRIAGVSDFRAYWQAHPAEFGVLPGLVRINGINKASVVILKAESRDQVIKHLPDYFTEESLQVFEEEMIALAEGHTLFRSEIPLVNIKGEHVIFDLTLTVQPGYENTLERVLVSFQDITETKRAEDALRASEERFATMFRSSPSAIAVARLSDNMLVDMNHTWEKTTGWSREAAIGKTVFELNLWVDPSERTQMKKLVAEHDSVQGFEMQLRSRSGSIMNLLMSAEIIVLQGEPCMITMTQDVTDRKVAEELLSKSQALLTEAQRIGHIGHMEWNGREQSLICSDEVYIILGLPRGTVVTQHTIANMMMPGERDRIQQLDMRSIQQHTDMNYEYRICSEDGSERWIHQLGKVTYGGDNAPIRMMAIIQDVTERKQADETLRENRSRIEMALKGANAAMWDWNVQTGETVFNERWAEILGYTLKELEPVSIQTWADLCHPDDLKTSENLLQKHFAGETEYYECEVRMRHKNGSWVWVIDRGRVMDWDTEGKPVRMFGTHLDITESKREEDYTQARLRLANLPYETLDTELLMRTMLDEAEALTDSLIGFFHFVDNDQNTINLQAWSTNTLNNLCTAEGRGQHYPVAQAGVWADGIRSGEPCIYNDYAALSHRGEFPKGHAPVTRLLSIPIKRNNVIVAVIGIGNKPREYDEKDLEIVKRLAEDAFDIVLRKRAEKELRTSEEKYRGLMESLDSVVATLDINGKFLYLNDLAASDLGNSQAELIGKTMYDLFPQEYAEIQMEANRKVIREDRSTVYESQNFVRGRLRWYRTSIQPIHDENGKVSHVLVNATDIDNLKTAQQELQEMNRTLEEKVAQRTAEMQDLYDNAPAGYHSLDVNGNLVMVNQTELNWLGYASEEMIGHSPRDFMTEKSKNIFHEMFPIFLQRGWMKDVELEFIRKNGSILPVSLNATAIRDNAGNFATSRSTIFDITERKKAEEDLRSSYDRLTFANIELEKAMQVKDEFLASMSHELRTPLTGILGFSEALQFNTYGELNEKQLKSVKFIEESGRHLLDLINDILDLSKIEAGKLDIQIEPSPLADICQAGLQLTKGMAHQKRQHVNYSAPTERILLNVDARRVKQIIVNLLGNAIKFTPEKGELGLTVEADETNHQVRLIVWDKGIGIKQENLPKLFRPFTQIDSSLAREYSGTGLGLSLVRRLAEIHDGTVTVESVFGEGSRFIVTLPWAPQTAHVVSPALENNQHAKSDFADNKKPSQLILIADDNQFMLNLLTDFLEAQNYHSASVSNGKELLEKIAEIKPALILMDVQMPGMDGLETIRRIRMHKDSAIASTPIIAVTALAMAGDRERCIEAGADDYISKPVKLLELKHIIHDQLI
jgi:PAS domain S-box-containing protein